MPYIVHREVRGKTYRYLAESYRDEENKSRQRNIKYLGVAPNLRENAPIAVVLFAGGGGVECGLIEAGIRPVISVERNPDELALSRAIADSNELNFKSYGGILRFETVQQVAKAKFIRFPKNPDYLIACPMCSNFSRANNDRLEASSDKEAAIAVVAAIKILKPKCFILENVEAYQYSESWLLIKSALEEYGVIAAVLDAADYGVPQNRKRFIVKAIRNQTINKFPAHQPQIGWYKAIEDLIDTLPDSELIPDQLQVVRERIECVPYHIPALLVQRNGYRDNKPQIREPNRPCWTIRQSIFTDGKNCNRSKFIDVWLADGRVKQVTIEAIARLQGFPSWYYFPEKISVAGSILGYSVPPPLIKSLLV